jgi:hypothetical protein
LFLQIVVDDVDDTSVSIEITSLRSSTQSALVVDDDELFFSFQKS